MEIHLKKGAGISRLDIQSLGDFKLLEAVVQLDCEEVSWF